MTLPCASTAEKAVLAPARAQDAKEGRQQSRGEPLGYLFDPVPRSLFDAIRADSALPAPPDEPPAEWTPRPPWDAPTGWERPQGDARAGAWRLERRKILNDRLRPVDADVLGVLLRYNRRRKDSCWSSKGIIARRIGRTERTVQHALRRLTERGFIAHVPVEAPEPDEPANRTGFRILLRFVHPDAPKPAAPSVDRRPPQARKVWTRTGAEREQPVSSPPLPVFDPPVSSEREQPVSSQARAPVSSKERACDSALDLDGSELDKETPSSSLRAGDGPAPAPPARTDDDGFSSLSEGGEEEVGELVMALDKLGPEIRHQCMPHLRPLLALAGGEAGALTVAIKKTAGEVWRGNRKEPIKDVLRYALSSALKGELGMTDADAVRAINTFSRGKRLAPVSSDEIMREDEEATRLTQAYALKCRPRFAPPPGVTMQNQNLPEITPAEGTPEEIATGLVGLAAQVHDRPRPEPRPAAVVETQPEPGCGGEVAAVEASPVSPVVAPAPVIPSAVNHQAKRQNTPKDLAAQIARMREERNRA